MISTEHESKYILTNEEYNYLLKLFEGLPQSRALHTNYYYDTPQEELRYKNITLRIREKSGETKGTVKRHFDGGHSTEEIFVTEGIPESMVFEEDRVYLAGKLETDRVTIFLSDTVTLMLDRNSYLGAEDFELELEYPKDFAQRAEGALCLIKWLLGSDKKRKAQSKSERFFTRLKNS